MAERSAMRLMSAFLALFLLLDGALLYKVQKNIEGLNAGGARVSELTPVPDGAYLKNISLGQASLLADILWLKAIQVIGGRTISPQKAKWLYSAVDAALTLDPKFWYMSEEGGVFLSAACSQYRFSNRIFRKGFDNNPRNWRLPFYLSTNYFLYLKRYKLAAYYMGRAARLPGRPAFVPLLASRLYAQAGDPRYGLELTEAIYENTRNEKIRKALLERMKQLQVEINLDALGKSINTYKSRFGRYPASVRELLAGGFIKAVPVDQLGGKYIINPVTGEVSNTKLPRRLMIYPKGK